MEKCSFDIGEFINDFAADKANVSTPSAINEFFEDLLPQARKKWPFDFRSHGYHTQIERADIRPDSVTCLPALILQMVVSNAVEEFQLKSKVMMEFDRICLRIENVYRSKGWQSTNFGSLLLDKLQGFIEAEDKARGKNFAPSEICIEASSQMEDPDILICGGYVWANHGFDFSDRAELEQARSAFKAFAAKQNVKIADKDLELFTKPCHFASFDCGVSVKNKFGKPTYLGKAFLLEYTWNGRLLSTPFKEEKAEEKRYAEAYNGAVNCGSKRRLALQTLSSHFRNMAKRYYRQYSRFANIGKIELNSDKEKSKLSKVLERL